MKKTSRQTFAAILLLAVAAILATGCSLVTKQANQQPEPTPVTRVQPEPQIQETDLMTEVQEQESGNPAPFVHTVRWRGETLSYIAKWYTGQFNNWKKLAVANPDLNPNRIRRGDEVVIPRHVLKKTKPMPKDFLARVTAKPKTTETAAPPTPEPAQEEEALPLFGPKD